MALWANSKIPARGFVRTAYFTPTVLPMIAAANLWLFFYTPGLGVLDQIGSLFGLPSVNWLGQPETALWAVIIVTIWKEAGFFMIFYLAALQTIPEDLKEAADIEGASRWTYTRRRSEEHTSELQSLMRTSYAVFCLNKKKTQQRIQNY